MSCKRNRWFSHEFRLVYRDECISNNQGHIDAVIMMILKCHFHWWRKPEYPEETTDLRQVMGFNHDHRLTGHTWLVFSWVRTPQYCVLQSYFLQALVEEETGVPGGNHRPMAGNGFQSWPTLSFRVHLAGVFRTPQSSWVILLSALSESVRLGLIQAVIFERGIRSGGCGINSGSWALWCYLSPRFPWDLAVVVHSHAG